MAGISLISETRHPCIITTLRERYAGRLQCGWEFFFTACSLFLISFVFIIISIYYLPYEGKRRTGWHGLYEMGRD